MVGASRGNIEGSGVGGVGIGTLLQVGLAELQSSITLLPELRIRGSLVDVHHDRLRKRRLR